jgi:hypothetical protein
MKLLSFILLCGLLQPFWVTGRDYSQNIGVNATLPMSLYQEVQTILPNNSKSRSSNTIKMSKKLYLSTPNNAVYF